MNDLEQKKIGDSDWKLPKELVDYLNNQNSRYDFHSNEEDVGINTISLFKKDELTEFQVYISTMEYQMNYGIDHDPNIEKIGLYKFDVVNLVKEVNDYSPEALLFWSPQLMQFGTFDCDHGVVIIFKDINWDKIIANIYIYINAQWNYFKYQNQNLNEEYGILDIYEFCNPWEVFEFDDKAFPSFDNSEDENY
jgi:hypothetical protein